MWDLYGQAKTWQVRPSALLGLEDDSYLAYCLDEAVAYAGNTIKAELEGVDGKNEAQVKRRRQSILNKYFGPPPGRSGFADPADLLGNTGKKADGR